MLSMIARRYDLPDHSFFLFGPRGAGKTTWLKHVLPDALWFDLLRTQVVLALSRQPESFRQQVEALQRGRSADDFASPWTGSNADSCSRPGCCTGPPSRA
jgi:hypothetical protein